MTPPHPTLFQSLRDRPIPETAAAAQAPLAPVAASQGRHHEKLVDVAAFGVAGRNHYAHDLNPPYWARAPGAIDALLVREAVGPLLASVDARLKPLGLRLFLFDAWRPRAVQAYFHDVWTPNALRARHPALSDAEIAQRVDEYWSAPTSDPARPAPHETGGAVDLTIITHDGAPLWMGSIFDDPHPVAHTRHFEREDACVSLSDEEARDNRRLLYWLMRGAGFANYANEWWHYSYGDRAWAASAGEAAAYGVAAPKD